MPAKKKATPSKSKSRKNPTKALSAAHERLMKATRAYAKARGDAENFFGVGNSKGKKNNK